MICLNSSHKRLVYILLSVFFTFNALTLAYAERKGKIYWTERHKIRCANLDGTDVEDLVTQQNLANHLTLDQNHGKMYWTDNFRRQIKRANLDGLDIETVIDVKRDQIDLASIWCMTIDTNANKIYWAGTPFRKLFRANLDGTNVKEFILNGKLANAKKIELDLKTRKIYWLNLTFNSISRTNFDGTEIEDLGSCYD